MINTNPLPAASVFLFCSAGICISLLLYALQQRRDRFTLNFVALMCASALYAVGYGAELMSSSIDGMFAMLRIQYLGIPFIPVFWLGLAWAYLDSRGLPLRLFFAMLLWAIATLIAFQTNELHHLFYRTLGYARIDGMTIAHNIKGPVYWLHIIYLNLCVVGGMGLFFRAWRQSMRIYQWQALCLLIGSFFPWIFHLIYITGFSIYRIDLSPFGLAVSGIFFAIASFRHGIFDILPVARDLVFDGLSEGVIVIDDRNHIIDFNLAAQRFIPGLDAKAIGCQLAEIPGGEVLAQGIKLSTHTQKDNPESIYGEITLQCAGKPHHFEVHLTPMADHQGKVQCHALLLLNITEKRQLIEQLHLQANTDPLTGVFNRRKLVELANLAVRLAQHKQENISVAIIDVDHFKEINDNCGHQAGDETLLKIASILSCQLRNTDILGRFGGDEFVIIMPDTGQNEALSLMQTLKSASQTTCGATLSIGIATSQGETGNFDILLRCADEQLYQAKESGRNPHMATSSMPILQT